MIGFGSTVEGYRVMHFTPQGVERLGIAYMFKSVEGLEPMVWTAATVVQDPKGTWRVNAHQLSDTDPDEVLTVYCELTGFVPGETS